MCRSSDSSSSATCACAAATAAADCSTTSRARAVDELGEPVARGVPVRDRAVLERALAVEQIRRHHLVRNQLLDAIEFPGLGVGPRGGAGGNRARLAHLLLACAGEVLGVAALRSGRVRARLFEARGRRRRIEPEEERARLDRLALAHGHFEDGLLVLGNELDAVALERAEERIAAVAARGERERAGRDGHPNWSNHAKSPARVPRFPRRRRVRR